MQRRGASQYEKIYSSRSFCILSILRRCKPWLFQGLRKKNTYFEGWYFKISDQNQRSFSFIPGISLSANDSHAFIQFIDGSSASTTYHRFELEEFSTSDEPFFIKIGKNYFGQDSLNVDLEQDGFVCKAKLQTSTWTPYPSGLFRPGIMGPFGLLGFLECYHGIVSANHTVSGDFDINGIKQSIENGKAYIEKDWGHSFPQDYIWTQANSFADRQTSVFVSMATIPFKGLEFPGLIAFVHLPKRSYVTFATWNRAKILHLSNQNGGFSAEIKRGAYLLKIKVRESRSGSLAAPRLGTMDRIIKESVDAVLDFELFEHGNPIASGSSAAAGLEMSGNLDKLKPKNN